MGGNGGKGEVGMKREGWMRVRKGEKGREVAQILNS